MRRLAHLDAENDADLRDARAASDALTLDERVAASIEWMALSVAELVARAHSPEELRRSLEGDAPVALRALHPRARRAR